MSECHISGCRNIDTKCNDCGRTLITRILPPSPEDTIKELITLHKIIHELQEKLNSQWISVDDSTPELNKWVLLKFDGEQTEEESTMRLGMLREYDGKLCWHYRQPGMDLPIHPSYWMPLPKAPHE